MKSNIANILRRLVVPYGAAQDQPRVVISTDDPLVTAIGQDAGISFYWYTNRGFIIAVEKSGEGETAIGQFRIYGYAEGAEYQFLSQLIEVDFDPLDGQQDSVYIIGGTRADYTAHVGVTGPIATLASSSMADESNIDLRAFGVSLPRGIRYVEVSTSNSGAIGTVESSVLSITDITYRALRAYRVRVGGMVQASTAGASAFFRLREGTSGAAAGRGEFGRITCGVVNTPYNMDGCRYLVNGTESDVTGKTLALFMSASTGTVTHRVTADTPRWIEIEDCGYAYDYPHGVEVS